MKTFPLCHKCADALFALNVFCPHKSQTLMGCKRDSRINSYEKAGIMCPLLPRPVDIEVTPSATLSPQRDLRTPEQWSEFFGVEVIDPDGWRHGNFPKWETPITRDMFKARYQMSTCRAVNMEKYQLWKHYLG